MLRAAAHQASRVASLAPRSPMPRPPPAAPASVQPNERAARRRAGDAERLLTMPRARGRSVRPPLYLEEAGGSFSQSRRTPTGAPCDQAEVRRAGTPRAPRARSTGAGLPPRPPRSRTATEAACSSSRTVGASERASSCVATTRGRSAARSVFRRSGSLRSWSAYGGLERAPRPATCSCRGRLWRPCRSGRRRRPRAPRPDCSGSRTGPRSCAGSGSLRAHHR